VKLVVPVRLYPGAATEAALRDTLTLCNQAAGLVSARAFETRVTSGRSLQRMVYGDLKAMGLSAQPAIHVARKVSGAYATLRANIRAGNLGDPGSKRRARAESKPIAFRADAAQAFDDRCLSWQLDRRTVSIWTTAGRMTGIRFRCSPSSPGSATTGRASRTWCTGTASATCTPPATSPSPNSPARTGSSASTWASRTSRPLTAEPGIPGST
jgi:hypothetical protein